MTSTPAGMTHADTLRSMAKAFMMVGSYGRVDTCIAGADALEAIGRVREVVEQIERVLARIESNPDHDRGVALAYGATLYFITEALEGDRE